MKRSKKLTFTIYVLLLSMTKSASGQTDILGKFIDYRLNTFNYIVLNPDHSFIYSRAVDIQRDISCGQYSIYNDTIKLFYKTNILDTTCNMEKINLVKNENTNSYFLLGSLDDTLARPKKLYFKENKLYWIEDNGHVKLTVAKEQVNYKPPKNERKFYYRKFLFFGPFIRKQTDAWIYKK